MNQNIQTIDTRGLSCPHPVMLTRDAIKKLNKGTLEVLADSGTARDNISRIAENSGWTVTVEDKPEGNFRILLEK